MALTVLTSDAVPIEDLIARIARADRIALRRLYDAVSPRLFAACLRILSDPREAGEALEQTFLTIWRYADQFEAGQAEPLAWLASLARDRAMRRRRASAVWKGDDYARPEVTSDEVLQVTFLEGLTYLDLAPRLAAGLGPAKLCVRRELAALGVAEEGDEAFLAAEFALGVLDADWRKAVNARMLTDMALADDVRAWNRCFEPFFEALADQRPPANVWARIASRLEPAPAAVGAPPITPRTPMAPARRRRWPLLLACAALFLAVVGAGGWWLMTSGPHELPRLPEPKAKAGPVGQAVLAGQLLPPKGDPLFLATLDAPHGEIVIVQAKQFLTDGRVLRLWFVDGLGIFRALGAIPAEGSSARIKIPEELSNQIAAGAEIEITLEPADSKGDAPSGPTIAKGSLAPA